MVSFDMCHELQIEAVRVRAHSLLLEKMRASEKLDTKDARGGGGGGSQSQWGWIDGDEVVMIHEPASLVDAVSGRSGWGEGGGNKNVLGVNSGRGRASESGEIDDRPWPGSRSV